MPNTIELGNITIQQIVEQQEPLFGIYEFLPDLAPETLEEHRNWLEPVFECIFNTSLTHVQDTVHC